MPERRILFVFVLIALLTFGNGCMFMLGHGYPHNDTMEENDREAEMQILHIDAVKKLMSQSGRHDSYRKIAGRKDLREPAQVHLVKNVFIHLISPSAKEDVLLTLIKNPNFGYEAEKEILNSLNKIISQSSRKRILDAIHDL